jgi:hypothetical protein
MGISRTISLATPPGIVTYIARLTVVVLEIEGRLVEERLAEDRHVEERPAAAGRLTVLGDVAFASGIAGFLKNRSKGCSSTTGAKARSSSISEG